MVDNTTTATARRKVLLLKGLVFGIPEAKYEEAMQRASEIIGFSEITTICWDGDKCTYCGEGGGTPSASYTKLLLLLHAKFPHLEFIFFKQVGKAASLLQGGEIAADDYGNVLGPIPFLTCGNTSVISSTGAPGPLQAGGEHYGIEFDDIGYFHELGLKGMIYIKTQLAVPTVDVLVLGLGGVVKEENEKVGEAPDEYPTRSMAVIEVQREMTGQRSSATVPPPAPPDLLATTGIGNPQPSSTVSSDLGDRQTRKISSWCRLC